VKRKFAKRKAQVLTASCLFFCIRMYWYVLVTIMRCLPFNLFEFVIVYNIANCVLHTVISRYVTLCCAVAACGIGSEGIAAIAYCGLITVYCCELIFHYYLFYYVQVVIDLDPDSDSDDDEESKESASHTVKHGIGQSTLLRAPFLVLMCFLRIIGLPAVFLEQVCKPHGQAIKFKKKGVVSVGHECFGSCRGISDKQVDTFLKFTGLPISDELDSNIQYLVTMEEKDIITLFPRITQKRLAKKAAKNTIEKWVGDQITGVGFNCDMRVGRNSNSGKVFYICSNVVRIP
jgi:hypothetical protein